MAAAALAAAPEVDAEPRFRRSRSRAGSVCAVDDAIGSIRIDDDEEEVGEFGRERSLGAGSDAATPVDADADDADDEGTRGKRASSSDNEGNNACFYFQRHTEAHKRPATVAEACLELDLLACDESAADVLASAPKQRRQPQNAAAAAVEEEEGGGGEEGEGAEQEAAAKTEEERALAVAAVEGELTPPAPLPLSQQQPFEGDDGGDSDDSDSSDGDDDNDESSLAREEGLRELLGNLLDAEERGGARPDPCALAERHGPPPLNPDTANASASAGAFALGGCGDDGEDFNCAMPEDIGGGGDCDGDGNGGGGSTSGGGEGGDHLDPRARSLTVAWLAEVASASRLHSETLHLAVSLLDRFLSRSPARVPRRALQLAAAAAALIAAKHEGEEHGGNGGGNGGSWDGLNGGGGGGGGGGGRGPTPARLAAAADHCFSAADIARMEGAILQALGFRVGAPTSAAFSAVLWRLASAEMRQERRTKKKETKELLRPKSKGEGGSGGEGSGKGKKGRARRERARASYLLELALLDNSMLWHAPSAVAAAAMLLACEAEAEAEAEAAAIDEGAAGEEDSDGGDDEGHARAVFEEDPRCAAAAAAAASVADTGSLRAAAVDLARLHAAAAASAQRHAEAFAVANASAAANAAAAAANAAASSAALSPQPQPATVPLPPPRPTDAVFARFAQPEWRAVALLPLLR